MFVPLKCPPNHGDRIKLFTSNKWQKHYFSRNVLNTNIKFWHITERKLCVQSSSLNHTIHNPYHYHPYKTIYSELNILSIQCRKYYLYNTIHLASCNLCNTIQPILIQYIQSMLYTVRSIYYYYPNQYYLHIRYCETGII